MVRATNAGGEAKSIADCVIVEPTPERMVEVVKTVIFDDAKDISAEVCLKIHNYLKKYFIVNYLIFFSTFNFNLLSF